MNRKGVNYDVGIKFHRDYLSRPNFDLKIVHRELEIIKMDLHCNAVRISGTEIDSLMIASEDALKQGFEVWLSPHLHDKDPQETLEYTVRCATAAEKLRRQWPHLVFILGCELTWFMQGILPGNNYFDRLGSPLSMWWRLKILGVHNRPLNGDYIRDEGLQARELIEMLQILDGAGVDGMFVFTFVSPALTYNENPRRDLDMASYSLVKSFADRYGMTYPDMVWEPKESFKAVGDYFARLDERIM